MGDADVPAVGPVERVITFSTAPTEIADFVAGIELAGIDPENRARPEGTDIHFVDASGAALAYEIEHWQPSGGHITAWVRIPLISATMPTEIRMRYGGDSVEHDSTLVWSGIAAGVWHLGGGDGTYRDSTAAASDAMQADPMLRPATTDGIAGQAQRFDGVDDFALIGDPSDGHLDFGIASFSYEAWVHVTGSNTLFDIPFWKGGSSQGYVGYDLELGTSLWALVLSDGSTTAQEAYFGLETSFLGRWVNLVAVIDREQGQRRAYADGALADMLPLPFGSLSSAHPAKIGSGVIDHFNGVIDELRIYPRALSAEWIARSFAQLAQPAQVYTMGAERPILVP